MNELQRLQHWHKSIQPDDLFIRDCMKLIKEEYKELIDATDRQNMKKEAVDLIVVAAGLLVHLDCDLEHVLQVVNDSNFSKLFLQSEAELNIKHYRELGVDVIVKPIDHRLFGVYSACDQRIGDKDYSENKLLKAIDYMPVDEETL